jgi:hypothetical protein
MRASQCICAGRISSGSAVAFPGQMEQHRTLTSCVRHAVALSSTAEIHMYNIPEPVQHKQLGLVWCESNLINCVIHQLHLRIQHRIDAFEIEQVAALHIDDVVGVSGGRVARVDVLRQHAFVVFEAGRSHVGEVVA